MSNLSEKSYAKVQFDCKNAKPRWDDFLSSPSHTIISIFVSSNDLPDVNPICACSPCIGGHFEVSWAYVGAILWLLGCFKVTALLRPN